MSALQSKTKDIVNDFTLPDGFIPKAVAHFLDQAREGLDHDSDKGMPMIPSFVTAVPKGTETGTFLAADLGGTNFRVCSVKLTGDCKFEIVQEKQPIPQEMMRGKKEPFLEHLASLVERFLDIHHPGCKTEEIGNGAPVFKMGFTFSFPVHQTSLNRGTLMRWTKGYDIKELVGKDIVLELQAALDKKKLPVRIEALVNDTVGTLMSRAYTKPLSNNGTTLVGCIFGTGTNGAYSEKLSGIKKFDGDAKGAKIMVINTEWGSFDNELKVLPNNRFDKQVNINSPNRDYHMFEKRVSGMFLGELLRLVINELIHEKLIFANQKPSTDGASLLSTPWSVDTSICSNIHADSSPDLAATGKALSDAFGFDSTLEERKALQDIVVAIGVRSAHLSAVPIAGIILRTKALEKFESIDIGADGSVVEFYPGFEEMIRDALRLSPVGDGEKKVTIGIAKDGSGVGAALCALVA